MLWLYKHDSKEYYVLVNRQSMYCCYYARDTILEAISDVDLISVETPLNDSYKPLIPRQFVSATDG